jgi:hypothetical protein
MKIIGSVVVVFGVFFVAQTLFTIFNVIIINRRAQPQRAFGITITEMKSTRVKCF